MSGDVLRPRWLFDREGGDWLYLEARRVIGCVYLAGKRASGVVYPPGRDPMVVAAGLLPPEARRVIERWWTENRAEASAEAGETERLR